MKERYKGQNEIIFRIIYYTYHEAQNRRSLLYQNGRDNKKKQDDNNMRNTEL